MSVNPNDILVNPSDAAVLNSLSPPSVVTEDKILKDLSEATGADVSMADLTKVSRIQYEVAFMQLMQNFSNSSVRGILRAVSNAVDLPVGSGLAKKLVSEEEARNAALMAQLLDFRAILQADRMQKELDKQQKVVIATEPSGDDNVK